MLCFFVTETIYQQRGSSDSSKNNQKDSEFINKLYRYVMHCHAVWMADEA